MTIPASTQMQIPQPYDSLAELLAVGDQVALVLAPEAFHQRVCIGEIVARNKIGLRLHLRGYVAERVDPSYILVLPATKIHAVLVANPQHLQRFLLLATRLQDHFKTSVEALSPP